MKTLTLSNAKANTFRRCEKKYEFRYIMGLRPKARALALERGNWLHQLLMVHADGHDWRERHALLRAQNWDNLFDEEREELGGNLPEEVERLFKGYLAHYKREDANWRTVDTEVDELVDMPNGMRMNVIIDRIVEDRVDGGLWLWDYKTVGQFTDPEFWLIDTQLALYFWAAKELGYRNLRGAIIDELITKPPTKPKQLKTGGLERRKNIKCDAYTYFACIKQLGLDPKDYRDFLQVLQARHDQWWRRTRMPRDSDMVNQVVKEMLVTGKKIRFAEKVGVYERTAVKQCKFDCPYLEPCMAQLQGADIEAILQIRYEKSKKPDEEDMKKLWPSQTKETHGRSKN
jgi:RecB family exonuclease